MRSKISESPFSARFVAIAFATIACAFASALTGCGTATVSQSVLPRLAGNDPQRQLDYWHEVATKTLIGNDEAFHGLLLYLDEKDYAGNYDQRVASLKSRGFVSRNFKEPAERSLDRGPLAVAMAKSLNIKGGLTMRLTGLSPRYASRELAYRGVYPDNSSTNQILTGAEFVGVIGKAEDFRQ